VDIVEAFTAMRHEWRGQAKESRALTEQIQTAVTNLQSLESKLLAHVAGHSSDNPEEARQLALLIVETDHQLSRAVTAIAQWEANRQLREAADANAVKRCFKGMNRVARWFARPLWILISEQRSAQGTVAEHPATEGLNLVLGRLRRMMHEQGIERLDVQGRPFDANTMHAIGTVASTDCPSGHVAEQLSPAYYWQGRLIRFSDVRVATRSARG
jgi:molecular chaperone GrpE